MSEITVITYRPEYREDFVQLNREWIERYFRLEKSDLHTLENTEEYILGNGGEIFLALSEGRAVGCCALIAHPENRTYELAKMAVDPSAQGRGIGRKLGKALIACARRKGARKLFLEGNTRLEASIALYRRLGFREVPVRESVYERCNIMMELEL